MDIRTSLSDSESVPYSVLSPSAMLLSAARNMSPVSGLSHNHYRYPARFSPWFARAAIELYTKPGDLVLDPFMGGGTTLVEALALGRDAIGVDISSLATFVSEVKTTTLSNRETTMLRCWSRQAATSINMHCSVNNNGPWIDPDYQKHLDSSQFWRLRKAIEQALSTAQLLRPLRLERFARCVVLRTAQWALDGRRTIPTIGQFRRRLILFGDAMLDGTLELREAATANHPLRRPSRVDCLHRSTIRLEQEEDLFTDNPTPALVLTSPPYPGIHVLYHRWQVDGRKETPAPFWIANKLDGSGGKYYTLGDRHEPDLKTYYANLRAAFRSVRKVCGRNTVVLQVLSFADTSWQLPKYLETMVEVGFEECQLDAPDDSDDGRLWRTVPNRRWHADQIKKAPGSQEVVLLHKVAL